MLENFAFIKKKITSINSIKPTRFSIFKKEIALTNGL